MVLLRSALLAVVLCVVLAPRESIAQSPVCGLRAEIIKALNDQYHEQMAGRGSAIGQQGIVVFELYVGATGSWTLVYSRPDGVSCIFLEGGNWEPRTAQQEGRLSVETKAAIAIAQEVAR